MLEDVKVLSFTHYLMGPSCSQMLADLGADVIKVESPKGAFERHWSGPGAFKGNTSVFFLLANRNVRSLAIDLKSEKGKEIIYRLIEGYDVIVENFRAGVMDNLGFSYEKLKAINPKLIYCSCTGYGSSGPYKNRPGQDLLLQSLSGLMDMTGQDYAGPTPVGMPIVDQHGAALAALGIVSAVYERSKTGKGRKIDVSLLDSALDLQMEPLAYYLNAKDNVAKKKASTGLASKIHPSPYGAYKTSDGYITLTLNSHANLVKIFEPNAFIGFTAEDQTRRRYEYDKIVAEQIKKRTTGEWEKIMQESGLWYAKVNDYDGVIKDPQVNWNKSIISFKHPDAGEVKVVGHPVRYDGRNVSVRRTPPKLGQDTEEILSKYGYDEETLAELRLQGVLFDND